MDIRHIGNLVRQVLCFVLECGRKSAKLVFILGYRCILGDIMACLTRLKEDIKFLEGTFSKKHERFQIISASVDEVACRFIGKNGEKFVIHANITVSCLVLYSLLRIILEYSSAVQ